MSVHIGGGEGVTYSGLEWGGGTYLPMSGWGQGGYLLSGLDGGVPTFPCLGRGGTYLPDGGGGVPILRSGWGGVPTLIPFRGAILPSNWLSTSGSESRFNSNSRVGKFPHDQELGKVVYQD